MIYIIVSLMNREADVKAYKIVKKSEEDVTIELVAIIEI